MEAFLVTGGNRLEGSVEVPGAKNSVLKLMAAALLAQGKTTITHVPEILDVEIMAELLRRLGADVVYRPLEGELVIDVPEVVGHKADYDLVRRMRASIAVLGPLIARAGVADVALPGGDAIGSRGLDMHIEGLQRMGAEFGSEHGFLIAHAEGGLHGAQIWLDFPSVGATENLVMAAVLAKGTTVIDNAAREPEIVDLCHMLGKMGAHIEGVGSSTLTIHGVESLQPTTHATVADRIVAGTWATMAAITMGDITIDYAATEHLEIALDKLITAGATVEQTGRGFRVRMERRPKAVDIVTLPYPGFPTDLQPQFIALNAVADGVSMVTENLFEARFRFVNELSRLGANVRTDGHHAFIKGRKRLSGAPVEATDVRAGAGLVMAGLVAEGVTTVLDVHHIDRGYARFTDLLTGLGGKIERVDADALAPA
ncbi:MAG: UDP-N-acetylglucosamine 1-carboxyvinyltransferase [Actinobacteria bacterium]|nr:UDP-N-acetylglucosamine 1-carboxyvinyltransferase [Actinomycetota bacterium]